MIITSIKLHPFAGISDLKVPLKAGLNVVLGPNEAGKSTLVSALNVALFESTKYRQPHWVNHLERFVPLQGGDVFQVSVEFAIGGDKYEISKTFGAEDSTRLVLPGGQSVVDQVTAEKQLGELLEFEQGTWRNVLICEQSTLPRTLTIFSDGDYATHELAEHLRSAIMDTDGVSLEKLLESANKKITDFGSNWDFERDRPRDNRGLDRKWQRNVGEILEAYYNHARLQADLEEIEKYERSHTEYTQKLEQSMARHSRLEKYLESNVEKYKAAQHVRTRKMEWDREKAKLSDLKRIQKQWVKAEAELDSTSQLEPDLAEKCEVLSKELERCQAASEIRQKEKQLKSAVEIEKNMRAATKRRGALKNVTGKHLVELERLEQQCQRAVDKIAASKLAIKLAVKRKWTGTVEQGLDPPKNKTISAGKTFAFQADGRAVVASDDWTMTIQSGDVDVAELQRQHDAAKKTLGKLLESHGVDSLKQAKQAHEKFEIAAETLKTLNTKLSTVLEGTTIAKLKEQVGQKSSEVPYRDFEVVQNEHFEAKHKLQNLVVVITELKKNLVSWKAEHKSVDKLGDDVADAGIDAREKQRNYEEAEEVLSGTKDVKELVKQYDAARNELDDVKQQKYLFEGELRGLGTAREENVSDLQLEIEYKDATLSRLHAEYSAYVRIQDAIEAIKERQQSDPLQPWVKDLQAVLSVVSGDRYENIDVEHGLAQRGNGMEVSYPQLSAGTKSVLGCALRLSMAEHFLSKSDGFFVLDDPLVDLDPDRQIALVGLIENFAKSKQVIILTCHPSHAKMFKPNPIMFERLA